jgi:hypothetical protein
MVEVQQYKEGTEQNIDRTAQISHTPRASPSNNWANQTSQIRQWNSTVRTYQARLPVIICHAGQRNYKQLCPRAVQMDCRGTAGPTRGQPHSFKQHTWNAPKSRIELYADQSQAKTRGWRSAGLLKEDGLLLKGAVSHDLSVCRQLRTSSCT